MDLIARFAEFAAGSGDELGVALLVNEALEAAVDPVAVRRVADDLAGGRPAEMPPWDYLRGLGFAGDATDYASLDNSRMDSVLERRRGIPITLGVLLVHVARHHGEAARGINFPGHFLVEVNGTFVDPFEMTATDRQSCLDQLPADHPRDNVFQPADAVAIGLRMLNNAKFRFVGLGDWHRALDMIDCQLQLSPDPGALHFERGELWLRGGAADMARDAFAESERLAAAPAVKAMAARRLAELGATGGGPGTVH